MAAKQTVNIIVSRNYDFPVNLVFDAWLDPKSARNWLFATPEGVMQRVEIDPVVGGTFVIIERRSEGDAEHFGMYLRIERNKLLEFTFSVDRENSDPDRVLVEFVPKDGGCIVTLTHAMDARWLEYSDRTRAGWLSVLEGLNTTLEKHSLAG